MARSRLSLAAVATAVMVVAGCSGGGGDSPGPDEQTTGMRAPQPLEPVWTTQVHVASQPVVVGDLVVAYVAGAGTLALAAFDPGTGDEQWRVPSTASRLTPGVALGIVNDDTHVYHLSPTGIPQQAVVQAVEVATGEPSWTGTIAARFGSAVQFCTDEHTSLCVQLSRADDVPGRVAMNIDGSDEHVDSEATSGRELDAGLYQVSDTEIALVSNGVEHWRKPAAELFGGHAVTPDAGWSFEEVDGVIVGSLGFAEERPESGTWTLTASYTAGFDAATGEALWLEEGGFWCDRIGGLGLAVDEHEPMIRCQTTGTMELGEEPSYDVGTVVEGFDPRTGEVTWTVELPEFNAMLDDDQPMVRLSPTELASVTDDGETFALDVVTGERRAASADEIGWCQTRNEYDYPESYIEDFPKRVGDGFAAPCTLELAPREVPAAVDEGIGAVAGDVFVWMDEEGLHGARIPG